MLRSEPKAETVLVFYNINSNSGNLEDLIKIKADYKICLGNLVNSFYANETCMKNVRREREERTEFLGCIEMAKEHNIRLLKGENETNCKFFPEKDALSYLPSLPTRIDRNYMTFLPSLRITEEEKKRAQALENRIKDQNKEKNTQRFTSDELEECHGDYIAQKLKELQEESPTTEMFFAGGRLECVLWERYSSFLTKPITIFDEVGDERGELLLPLYNRHSSGLVFPGSAEDGFYCTLGLPDKKLILYST